MKSLLCNHDVLDPNCSLRPFIKVPQQSLSEREKEIERMKPDGKCIVCGEEMFISYREMKGVTCVRK